jgi:hypothetical protein
MRRQSIVARSCFARRWSVFGLWNSCGSRNFAQETGHWLARGDFPISVGTAVRALRAASVDDGDIARYLAYSNAVLGRPYQSYFVRPLAGWRAEDEDPTRDPADPTQWPPTVPSGPLTPWRDFSVEYPPGFFLFALPPALLADDIDHYRPLFSIAMGLVLTAALLLARRTVTGIDPSRAGKVLPWLWPPPPRWGDRRPALRSGVVGGDGVGVRVGRSPSAPGRGGGRWASPPRAAVAARPAGAGLLAPAAPHRRGLEGHRGRHRDGGSAGAALRPARRHAASRWWPTTWVAHLDREHAGVGAGGGRFFDPGVATLAPTHGSHNVVSAWDGPLRALAAVLPLLALAGCLLWASGKLLAARSEGERGEVLIKAASASLVGLMALGTVFSPQYVVWLIPLGVVASILGDRTSAVLLLIALALTQVEYPYLYATGLARALHPAFGLLVMVRNVLLLVWAGRLLVRPLSLRTDATRSAAGSEALRRSSPCSRPERRAASARERCAAGATPSLPGGRAPPRGGRRSRR